MTNEQFRHWQQFAIRMAHRGWPGLPRKSRHKVAGLVTDFFRDALRDYASWTEGLGPDIADLISRIRNWDNTAPSPREKDMFGRPEVCGTPVGDMVTTFLGDGNNPHYWGSDNRAYEDWEQRWGTRVRCCLRAGLDVASEPSGGVVGFTMGDLRRMYRGRLPRWLTDQDWTYGRMDEAGQKVPMAAAKDDAEVWL